MKIKLHLVAGFRSESDIYFSPCIILFTTSVRAFFPHCVLVSVTVLVSSQANASQMNKKQTSLEGFFEKGERPNDETAERSKIANKKKAEFKRKYQESYLNYRFIATGDSHSPSPLCIICGD